MKSLLCIVALCLPTHLWAFDLQGHRGARGLFPENTLGGFARTLALGVNTLELDLALSADDVPVVSHDPALNPDLTRDDSGRWLADAGLLIRSLRQSELAAFDVGRLRPGSSYAATYPQQQPLDGERIPTLDEVFRRFKSSGVNFNIEIKTFPHRPEQTADVMTFVWAVLNVVDRHDLQERVTLQSFDWRVTARVRELAPRMTTAQLTIERGRNNNVTDTAWTDGRRRADYPGTATMVRQAGHPVWSPFHQDLTEAQVREARALGLKVIPWTVNETADMDRLLSWGVDGLITDYPDRLRAALSRRAMPLPPAWR